MRLLLDELDELIKEKKDKNGVTHDTGIIDSILPKAIKRRTIGKERFPQVLGEFTRLISQVEISQDVIDEGEYSHQPVIDRISKAVECDDEDVRFDLELFLNNYMFQYGNNLNQIHPYIFNYTPLSNVKDRINEEKKVAKFMKDVLVEDISEFQHVFQTKEEENLLTSLILENLEELEKQNEGKQSYTPLMKLLSSQFKEDFMFISKHRDYFLDHYPILTQFYYFLYWSQLTLKFSQYDNADYEKVNSIYFALDWESINKRRKAANEMEGYKLLKERASDLFIHMHAMSQLSYNSKNVDEWRFFTYNDLVNELNDTEDRIQFLESLNAWIDRYTKKANLKKSFVVATSLTEAFGQLVSCLREGMNTQVYNNFGELVTDAAGNKFLKSRGNIGNTLNLTQDFLLLLTAVSVKDERIPLKKLFEEFEKRGVALDRYSKKEVIELLDNLNIIDKKSDSGDSQYVKPIL